MARKMVTREFKLTRVNVLMLNTETGEPYNKPFMLKGEYTDPLKAMKKVKETMKDDDVNVACKVVDLSTQTQLLGMLEEEFIERSILLDPATRKPSITEDTEDTENENE